MKEEKPGSTEPPFEAPEVEVPPCPPDLQEFDNEVEESSSESETISTFDNVKIKKCNKEQHVITKVVTVLKKKEIMKEYQSNKCNCDYHDNCESSWKSCDSEEAKTFCPKACKQTNCYRLRFHGYTNPNQRPTYSKDKDDEKRDCKFLAKRGDCTSNANVMSDLCPETCRYTKADKDYLPYIPEEQKNESIFQAL